MPFSFKIKAFEEFHDFFKKNKKKFERQPYVNCAVLNIDFLNMLEFFEKEKLKLIKKESKKIDFEVIIL